MNAENRDRSVVWALPSLAGRLRWPFMALWSVLLALCLASAALVLVERARQAVAPPLPSQAIGLVFARSAPWPTIGQIAPSAARAGLHQGDRLTLVDGRSPGRDATALNRQLAGPVGSRVALTVAASDGRTSRHVVIRDPAQYREAFAGSGLTPAWARLIDYGLSYLFSVVLMLACAIVLMARRSRDPLAPWASLMMLTLVLGGSMAGVTFARWFADPEMVYGVANVIGFSLLIIVLSVFPTGRFEPRWSLAVAIIGTLVNIYSEPLPTAISNALLVLIEAGAVAAIAARYRRMPPGPGRQQIRWALLGIAASVLVLLLLSLVQFAEMRADAIGRAAWLRIAGTFFVATTHTLIVVSITVSLLRYRLYDADATISRSVIYGALTLGLLAIFAGSEKLIELMGEEYFGERLGALAGALGAAAAAVMIVPLHHRITHWAEKRFRSGLVRLRQGLPLLVGDMRETATPAALAEAVLLRVERGIRARQGALVTGNVVFDTRSVDPETVTAWLGRHVPLQDDQRDLLCDRADPLFPIRLPLHAEGPGLVGWLLLGPRPDGTFYGREEREALREIADPVARALAIAIERDRRERLQAEREGVLLGHLDELRRLVFERLGIGGAAALSGPQR